MSESASPEGVPELECDLVMKGGVTSGIVYPAAISAVASRYRLRSIGGTSAGAIGAAAAAAMEFGRQSGRNVGARGQLEEITDSLARPIDGKPMLFRLFEPDGATAPLFRLLLQLQEIHKKAGKAAVGHALLAKPLSWAMLVVAAIVLSLAALSSGEMPFASAASHALVLFFGIPLLAILFAALKWVPRLSTGLRAVADNGYGFCSGMASYRSSKGVDELSLAAWLHLQYQTLAGLPEDEPLTFGDLWTATRRVEGSPRHAALENALTAASAGQPESPGHPLKLDRIARDIDLSLVASDINRAQSVQLPFMRREDRIFARISDLVALLPAHVVDWMRATQRETSSDYDDLRDVDLGTIPADDIIRLPLPQDLPVLFAVRMSLSFPFLFRAVRLYVIRRRGGSQMGKHELAELWLADGGITSNFPIHLFDAPLPTRPTFCLNLLYHDDELEPDDRGRRPVAQAPAEAADDQVELTGLQTIEKAQSSIRSTDDLVYMLRTNGGRLSAYTRFAPDGGIAALARFGTRIVSTARQWGDNQLIDVPGYRDRIVHIRMLPDEGGFNFGMESHKIDQLKARGRRAGEIIGERFDPKTTLDPLHPNERLVLNWPNHRFVRFRSFLAGLEVMAARFGHAWRADRARAELKVDDPRQVFPSVEQIVEEFRPGKNPFAQKIGYPFANDDHANLALEAVKALASLEALSEDAGHDGLDYVNGRPSSPRPKAGVKLRPATQSDPLHERP